MPRYSIIIGTYGNHLETELRPCVDSILKYTTLNDFSTELIIVANGCTDNTREYVEELQGRFHNINLIWFDEGLGFPRAYNAGIQAAKGEYIVLFNNDNVVLDQYPYNTWLDILNAPFKEDPQVGLTGPMMEHCPHADRDFILFFCAMISRAAIDKVGLLDVAFSPGYGEDADYAARLQNAGFKVVQVPDNSRQFYDTNRRTGNFPLWHAGNKTFANWPGGEEVLRKNQEILKNKYNNGKKYLGIANIDNLGEKPVYKVREVPDDTIFLNIEDAKRCDGFMSDDELYWLAAQATKSKIIIEVGSWHGKSSRALADNMPGGAKLYCVDHWAGSAIERESNHASAKWNDGDHAFMEFSDNMADHIKAGRVVPIRMSSKNAAAWFKKHEIKADMIFIDAGHTYEEVKEDMLLWTELCEKTFCGHDYQYTDGMWEGVTRAVDELVEARRPKGTNIWVATGTKKKLLEIQDSPKVVNEKVNIYDCFPFYNELDILDIRFAELDAVVDRWVITEATLTHQGKPKPLYFRDNLQRYEKYLHKVTHIVVDQFPATDSWSIERHQRDELMKGLTQCKDNDIIMITDADEIPRAGAIYEYDFSKGIMGFEQRLFYYNLNCESTIPWDWAKITSYREVKAKGPCGIRYTRTLDNQLIKNGGWHWSYMGDIDTIINKIGSTAHIEYSTEEMKNRDRVERVVREGKDLFGRNLSYNFVEIDSTYPKYVLDHIEDFKEKGLITELEVETV